MCPSLVVEIRSVTSKIRRRKSTKNKKKEEEKKERDKTGVKYKPFGIAMPYGLTIELNCGCVL